ncbi:lipopolysaccharide core biosynthesis protein RfaZ [Moellerella wisconsensis]|uniref:lipopolysaccharide core biosynthesis protein RfaZ n=1 Tax=Moellerella wisconsensis TaxID=158849 RepID=UPI00307687F2
MISNDDIFKIKKNDTISLCFSGPSVSKIDDDYFKDNNLDYLGVNGSISLKAKAGVDFLFYVIIDETFIRSRRDLVKIIIQNNELILFCNYRVIIAIFSDFKFNDIKCKIKIIETIHKNIGYRFLGKSEIISSNEYSFFWFNGYGFSNHLDEYFFDYGTVAYVSLQIAVALGYKKINLIGLDMNNFNSPRFYESDNNKLPSVLEDDFIDIDNAFLTASIYCENKSISVNNLSEHSAIIHFNK